jgi:ornithine racemase
VTLRLEADLDKVEQNTRILVDRLATTGIRVTGITKAVLGSPGVGAAASAIPGCRTSLG